MLESWERRPSEEANLFNPAFCGVLVCEFVKAFAGRDKPGAPLPLVLVALTISLHQESRDRLPGSTAASFYQWVQGNESMLIEYSKRAGFLTPYILEGVRFGIRSGTLAFQKGHVLGFGNRPATYTPSKLQNDTEETKRIVEKTRMLGRWLTKSGEETFILSAFGVRP